MLNLYDRHQRKFSYLRLSVTDRCNFRCVYCLPNGYQKPNGDAQSFTPELSIHEIQNLVRGFSLLGINKVRLTGGEPTVRRDIVAIAQAITDVPAIKTLAITTNGHRLKNLAAPLYKAGVTAINLSLDSLEATNFKAITGSSRYQDVIEGLEIALNTGFKKIKVNVVLLKDSNDQEVDHFMEWVKNRPIAVRFIELMETSLTKQFFKKHHVSAGAIQLKLLQSGWQQELRNSSDGPAVVYRNSNYQGSIGIIAPYSKDFCNQCNRLRVSAQGMLRLCLFGEKDLNLRPWIQDLAYQNCLVEQVTAAVLTKPPSHYLKEGRYGNTPNLAAIGG